MYLDVIGQLLQQNILMEARGGLSVKTHVMKVDWPPLSCCGLRTQAVLYVKKLSFFFGKMTLLSFSALLGTVAI